MQRTIAIVGGGASGTLLCLRLLESGSPPIVHLIERKADQLGRGVAYSCKDDELLNVPAGGMDPFPERPGGFLRWLANDDRSEILPEAFVPRKFFGQMLASHLHQAIRLHPQHLTIHTTHCSEIREHSGDPFELILGNGDRLSADLVVLAVGNAPPATLPGLSDEAFHHPAHIPVPWNIDVAARVEPEDAVLIVGSGLSMVDLIPALFRKGHSGGVTVISRHGRLPMPHRDHMAYTWQLKDPPEPPYEVIGLFKYVRSEIRRAASIGVAWQEVFHALRSVTQQWWLGMPIEERMRFLRHVRNLWDIHRHRIPAAMHDHLTKLIATGAVQLHAGRISRIVAVGERLNVTWHSSEGEVNGLFDHVVNCTGPQYDSCRMDQPLLQRLLSAGLASCDPLGIGLRSDENGELIGSDGTVTPGLYAIGPLRKAMLWETTAIKEIAGQAIVLASLLVNRPLPAAT